MKELEQKMKDWIWSNDKKAEEYLIEKGVDLSATSAKVNKLIEYLVKKAED